MTKIRGALALIIVLACAGLVLTMSMYAPARPGAYPMEALYSVLQHIVSAFCLGFVGVIAAILSMGLRKDE